MCGEEFTYLRAPGRSNLGKKSPLLSTQQAAAYYDPVRSSGGLSNPRTAYSPPISST